MDFCRDLEVSRPTVMRDIEWLRDDEGAPLEYVPGKHGYRLADERWRLPPLSLNRGEVFAMAVAQKLLAAFRGTPLESEMSSALEKAAESIEGRVTIDPAAFTDNMTVIADDYVVQDAEKWLCVADCVDCNERIRIVYRKFDGAVGGYTLDPYHMFAYHGNWYLAARHPRRNRIATFAVSRIRSLQRTGETFEPPGDFDVNDYVGKSFGIVRGEETFEVRLLFSRKVAAYIEERVWHPSQEVVHRRDGALELRLRTAGWNELVRWVLSWQPDVRVLAPAKYTVS